MLDMLVLVFHTVVVIASDQTCSGLKQPLAPRDHSKKEQKRKKELKIDTIASEFNTGVKDVTQHFSVPECPTWYSLDPTHPSQV